MVAGFYEITGDVNAGDVGAQAGDWKGGSAVSASEVENAHPGFDAERFGECVA